MFKGYNSKHGLLRVVKVCKQFNEMLNILLHLLTCVYKNPFNGCSCALFKKAHGSGAQTSCNWIFVCLFSMVFREKSAAI